MDEDVGRGWGQAFSRVAGVVATIPVVVGFAVLGAGLVVGRSLVGFVYQVSRLSPLGRNRGRGRKPGQARPKPGRRRA